MGGPVWDVKGKLSMDVDMYLFMGLDFHIPKLYANFTIFFEGVHVVGELWNV
jgi:hypothetical protein